MVFLPFVKKETGIFILHIVKWGFFLVFHK